MSRYDINSNPALVRRMLAEYEAGEAQMRQQPDSVLLAFKQELLALGFRFQVLNQAESFMPKYKDVILPLVLKYYRLATRKNEKEYLLGWLHHRGLEEAVPLLLEEYYAQPPAVDRWFISDRLYQIRSRAYIDDYLRIISNPAYGRARQMVILLVGKLKVEAAVPILIGLLEDEEVRLHAIIALGQYKREEFRGYFERFQDAKQPGWRKYARAALKKLEG